MEFQHDPDDFDSFLGRVQRDWTRANESVQRYVEHWKEVAREHSHGLYSVDLESGFIKGVVLGKEFFIGVTPLASDQAGFVEAILYIPRPDNSKIELGRFRVDRNGSVFNDGGALVIDQASRYPSYHLLTSIIRTVLTAQTPSSR